MLSDEQLQTFAERLVALTKKKEEEERQANKERHKQQLGMGLYLQSILMEEEAQEAEKTAREAEAKKTEG